MVWIASEYEPHEGGDVEGVFNSKEKAIEFVKSKLQEPIEINDYPQDDMFDRPTIFLKSDVVFMRWKIEEWPIIE